MSLTLPGPTLGVVGGGQLGRMLAEAAAPLGVEVVVLDPTPNCPAAPVARDQVVGAFDDPEAVRDLAARSDALTLEIELADPDLLETVRTESGVPVNPDPTALRTTRDKLAEKRALADADIPVAPFRAVDDATDLRDAVEEFGRVMLKARTGGYDGRGNVPVSSPDEAERALETVGAGEGGAVAEAFVEFERELAVIGVNGDGETDAFPVTETIHEEEILRETVTPARADDAVLERADETARDVLSILEGRGVYGIELFETADGRVLVNEIAPRPHNSGHWTIEGSLVSQFEQHVRAVLGWPLGSTHQREATALANVLGDGTESRPATLAGVETVLDTPNASMHWYGKREVRPLRKMGHLTAVGEGREDLLETARSLRDGLSFESGGESA